MRPRPSCSRRALARAIATLAIALWPALAVAGPPVLPPAPGSGGALETPAAPMQGGSFASPPVQRPAGMPVQRPATPVQPTGGAAQPAPVQPAGPTAAPVQPAGPTVVPVQPVPVQPVGPSAVSGPPAPQPGTARPATSQPAPAQPTPSQPGTARPATTIAPPPATIGPQPAAVSPPGPIEPDGDPDVSEADSPEAALVAQAQPARKKFPHRGIVGDFRIGTLGCIGGLCRGGHDISPGVRLGGFFGGNIRGWVELGVGGGWGTLTSKVAPGTNAMALYGLDPYVLQLALLAQAAGLVNVDLAGLSVQDDKLRVAQVGPSVRVHLLPRGRVGAFVGTGVGYNVLRARYETGLGAMGMDFHGIHVPVEANLSVYVLEHLAVGMQFDYMWTWYGLAVLDHPQQRIPIPMRMLEASAATQGVNVREQLPQFWTLGLAIRGRV